MDMTAGRRRATKGESESTTHRAIRKAAIAAAFSTNRAGNVLQTLHRPKMFSDARSYPETQKNRWQWGSLFLPVFLRMPQAKRSKAKWSFGPRGGGLGQPQFSQAQRKRHELAARNREQCPPPGGPGGHRKQAFAVKREREREREPPLSPMQNA